MSHGVDDVIDSQLEGEVGIFTRIDFDFSPLPGVSQVDVVIDHHHEPSLLILYALVMSLIAPFLPGSPAVNELESRDLDEFLDVVVAVKDRVADVEVNRLVLREDLLDLSVKILPFVFPVKVIHHQKASSEQVLPQMAGLLVR